MLRHLCQKHPVYKLMGLGRKFQSGSLHICICTTQQVIILRSQVQLLFPSHRLLRCCKLRKKNVFIYLAIHKYSMLGFLRTAQLVFALPTKVPSTLTFCTLSVCGRKVINHIDQAALESY